MQNGFVEASGAPLEGELELINQQARRKLSADEVYVFSVVLCDNEIDRDFERFTIDALGKLAKLFVGKSGIFDHSMKGRDQVARIFSAGVEAVPNQLTSDGQPYHRLKARAYMPKSPQNESMILDIDSGIKREVSVGCAVADRYCSICGTLARDGGCSHLPGRSYAKDGKKQLCYAVLDNPTDAYEWSFVAVPAQPLAGVVKSRKMQKEEMKTDEEKLLKTLKTGDVVTLSRKEADELSALVSRLRADAALGGAAEAEIRRSVKKMYAIGQPAMPQEVLDTLMQQMEPEELKKFWEDAKRTFGAQAAQPQLASRPQDGRDAADFKDFMI